MGFSMRRYRPIATALIVFTVGTTAGWAAASTRFATDINKGLVTALNSVGQNLFGTAVFAAYTPPDPIFPADPMRIDFAANSRLPLAFNVFSPPNPIVPNDSCRTAVQVRFFPASPETAARAVLTIDEAAGFTPQIVYASLATVVPRTSQCPQPPQFGDQ